MDAAGNPRVGDFSAMLRASRSVEPAHADPAVAEAETSSVSATVLRKRHMVAGFCRLLGEQISRGQPPQLDPPLSPRMRQTLERLLTGDSEKQIANRLGLSPHTVHVYVKGLYRRFNVSSRGELLARWIKTGN